MKYNRSGLLDAESLTEVANSRKYSFEGEELNDQKTLELSPGLAMISESMIPVGLKTEQSPIKYLRKQITAESGRKQLTNT